MVAKNRDEAKYLQCSKVYVHLYSALRKAPVMRSNIDHTMPAFTSQPQNITTLWLVLILTVPRRVEG